MRLNPSLLILLATTSLLPSLTLAANVVTVDSGPLAGNPVMAIGSDGLPVLAYMTSVPPYRFRTAKCRNLDCSQWTIVDQTDAPPTTVSGEHLAIAIAADGMPAIAFKDSVLNQLVLLKCSSHDCTGSRDFRIIDPGPHDVGNDVALAFDAEGRAAFAYQDATDGSLLLARCRNPGCANINIEILGQGVANVIVFGESVSVAFGSDGLTPAVSEHWTNHLGSTGIFFYLCSSSPCSALRKTIEYNVAEPIGPQVSMTLAGGDLPVFSYQGEADTSLRFDACPTPDCSGFLVRSTLDSGGSLSAGAYSAISVRPDGRPVIAYQRNLPVAGGGTALYVVECQDPVCDSYSKIMIETAGSGVNAAFGPAIAIAPSGAPMIAYFDDSSASIKLALCNPQICFGPGDRLFADGFDR